MSKFLDHGADRSKQRNFDLGDVLAVTTKVPAASTRQLDGLYDIVGYVTGDPKISALSVSMMLSSAQKTILQQHPQLASVTFPDVEMIAEGDRKQVVNDWLSGQKDTFGKTLSISPAKISLKLSLDEQIDYVNGINPNIQVVDFKPESPQRKTPTRKPDGPRS